MRIMWATANIARSLSQFATAAAVGALIPVPVVVTCARRKPAAAVAAAVAACAGKVTQSLKLSLKLSKGVGQR